MALGYFFWYTPYAALAKTMSSGLLPGMDKPVGGLVLLPAAAIGTLIGAPIFLLISGWWRYIGVRRLLGRLVRRPSRTMILAGLFTSLVIATTTLNYTFAGVSILFMLLMMRAGVLIFSPIVDKVHGRRVRIYSWVALGFSLLAVGAALKDVNSYELTLGAVVSLAFYFGGYIGRFEIMSRVAKTTDEGTSRSYFAEEAISSAVWQVLLCGALALVGPGVVAAPLREGFTTLLFSPLVVPALIIGLLYSALYVYGTLIYLDIREYTWCVPANRCASIGSGLVASFGLTWLTGIAPPGAGQLIATGFILLAILALSYPALSTAYRTRLRSDRALLLFVCSGNTCRSAMAEAIARSAIATHGLGRKVQVISAGIEAHPGAPMLGEAMLALDEVGVAATSHNARKLTPQLIARADAVYCMTTKQCNAVIEMAPDAADKITCLDPDGEDVADPHGSPQEVYVDCAEHLQSLVDRRLEEATQESTDSGRQLQHSDR